MAGGPGAPARGEGAGSEGGLDGTAAEVADDGVPRRIEGGAGCGVLDGLAGGRGRGGALGLGDLRVGEAEAGADLVDVHPQRLAVVAGGIGPPLSAQGAKDDDPVAAAEGLGGMLGEVVPGAALVEGGGAVHPGAGR